MTELPRAKAILKAVRLHQSAKNILIFTPMLLAHVFRAGVFADAAIAFISFSLCASSTYIANDLLDIESDRRHPHKRARPFAAGDLSVPTGILMSAVLLGGSIAIAATLLPHGFLLWLFLYLVATLSYSLYFKRVVLVDVILLAGLYTVRLLAGASATKVDISPRLAAFSVFLFLSLAMVKRFSELQNTRARGQAIANGRGYLLGDIEQLRAFGTVQRLPRRWCFSVLHPRGRPVRRSLSASIPAVAHRAVADFLAEPRLAARLRAASWTKTPSFLP